MLIKKHSLGWEFRGSVLRRAVDWEKSRAAFFHLAIIKHSLNFSSTAPQIRDLITIVVFRVMLQRRPQRYQYGTGRDKNDIFRVSLQSFIYVRTVNVEMILVFDIVLTATSRFHSVARFLHTSSLDFRIDRTDGRGNIDGARGKIRKR